MKRLRYFVHLIDFIGHPSMNEEYYKPTQIIAKG
jgi:hypothetical protein